MYHNYHHLKNIGNFGSMFIMWDSIFGTNSYYYKDISSRTAKKLSLIEAGSVPAGAVKQKND
jgi:sterol desaturase/sphingolipid hydroxylase (fatty acid hydroxylase superfamily)